MDTWRTKLDKALYEKNAFTDVLATAEAKTGVKRTYFVAGLYPNYFQIDIHHTYQSKMDFTIALLPWKNLFAHLILNNKCDASHNLYITRRNKS